MTAVTPRLPWQRLRHVGNPFAKVGRSVVARLERREQLARPPAYVVLCATVTVLNVVGLVMILSASSRSARPAPRSRPRSTRWSRRSNS